MRFIRISGVLQQSLVNTLGRKCLDEKVTIIPGGKGVEEITWDRFVGLAATMAERLAAGRD